MLASEDKPWFEVYRAAILELDSQKLPHRIVAAKEAVRLRLKEIEGDTDHHAERQQIEDALHSLRTLETTEVIPGRIPVNFTPMMNRSNQNVSEKISRANFPPLLCPICRQAVATETAKTDEDGNAIHEDCYVLKLKLG